MTHREELASLLQRAATLQAELDALRRDSSHEIATLRAALDEARAVMAREAELREVLEAMLGATRSGDRRPILPRTDLDLECELLRQRVKTLQTQLADARTAVERECANAREFADREARGRAREVALWMRVHVCEARAEHILSRLAEHETVPVRALIGDGDVAAFGALFSEAALAALPEPRRRARAHELALRIAMSIYDGRAFDPQAIVPALTSLRGAGHAMEARGNGVYVAREITLEATAERYALTVGPHRFEIAIPPAVG